MGAAGACFLSPTPKCVATRRSETLAPGLTEPGSSLFSQVYRFFWFIEALEFIVIFSAAVCHSLNQFRKYRVALLGLFTVATILQIEATDAFLTGKEMPRYHVDELEDRAWTRVAGCMMVCISNFFFLLVGGLEDDEAKLL